MHVRARERAPKSTFVIPQHYGTSLAYIAILCGMEQQRYKLTEAARILGMSPWTLRRWVYAGRAPVIETETGRLFIPAWWIAEQSGQRPGVRADRTTPR